MNSNDLRIWKGMKDEHTWNKESGSEEISENESQLWKEEGISYGGFLWTLQNFSDSCDKPLKEDNPYSEGEQDHNGNKA